MSQPMEEEMHLKIGDKVYRSLNQKPFEVIEIKNAKAHIKRGLEQKWILCATIAANWTLVGSASDKQIRKEFYRHGYDIDDCYCTYPNCKCIVSTSTSQPDPVCPKELV